MICVKANRVMGVVALCSLVVAGAALAGGSVDLYDGGDRHEGIGQGDTKDLFVAQAYRASGFPVAVGFRQIRVPASAATASRRPKRAT